MKSERELSREEKVELHRELEEIFLGRRLQRRRKPRAVLVCCEGLVVGDADVIVSERDPNWYRVRAGIGFDGRIKVRR
jgi:hypothetical protein